MVGDGGMASASGATHQPQLVYKYIVLGARRCCIVLCRFVPEGHSIAFLSSGGSLDVAWAVMLMRARSPKSCFYHRRILEITVHAFTAVEFMI